MKTHLLLVVSVSFLAMLSIAPPGFSQHGHGGGTSQPAMKMASTDVFADGVQVTFMVMRNETHKGILQKMNMKEDLEPGSTHNIMVLIRDEKTGKELTEGKVRLKVIDSDDKEQLKPASYKEMMRTHDAYFNLSGSAKYQVTALFELNGQKRAVGISHEVGS